MICHYENVFITARENDPDLLINDLLNYSLCEIVHSQTIKFIVTVLGNKLKGYSLNKLIRSLGWELFVEQLLGPSLLLYEVYNDGVLYRKSSHQVLGALTLVTTSLLWFECTVLPVGV